jgi:hypothetical protein
MLVSTLDHRIHRSTSRQMAPASISAYDLSDSDMEQNDSEEMLDPATPDKNDKPERSPWLVPPPSSSYSRALIKARTAVQARKEVDSKTGNHSTRSPLPRWYEDEENQ